MHNIPKNMDGVMDFMKNQCIRAFRGRWLALLLSALLLLGMLPAPVAAAEAGSLNIMLSKDTFENIPKDPAVEVTLYQIGVPDGSTAAGWRIDDAFKGFGILKATTSAELGVVAENIARDIVGKSQYKGTTKALTGGSEVFPVDELGVYFGMVTKAPEGVKVTPFIVTVPYRDPETRQLRTSYDVVLKDPSREKEFIDMLRMRNGNLEINVSRQATVATEL